MGLTILELVVVCAIIALLAALLLPAIASMREAARRAQCVGNLHQIGIALSSYHDVYRALPPGWRLDSSGHSAFGWAAAILPNVECGGLGENIDFLASVDSPQNAPIRHQQVPLFLCPSDIATRSFALYRETGGHDARSVPSSSVLFHLPNANYVGVFGISDPDDVDGALGEGAFIEDRCFRFADFRRGLSNTFVVGERTSRKLPSTWFGVVLDGEDAPSRLVGFAWLGPNRDDADECEFDSRHPGCSHFLWADGHVTPVSESIDGATYRQFALRR